MKKNSQAVIEYLFLFAAIFTAITAANFLGRMRDGVITKFFDKAVDKIESMR